MRAETTLLSALDAYLAERTRLAPRTVASYRERVAFWLRWAESPLVSAVTVPTICRFRRECQASKTTIESTIAVLRFLVESAGGELPVGLERPQPDPDVCSLEDFGRLYSVADKTLWPLVPGARNWAEDNRNFPTHYAAAYWRTLLAAAYFTGLRKADLLHVTWAELRGETLHRQARKTSKVQRIPVHPVLRRHLDHWQGLTCGTNGTPIFPGRGSNKQFNREFRRLNDLAGTSGITCQPIRVLAVNEWDDAFPGAGAVLQGSGLRGSYAHYRSSERLLRRALPQLRVPNEMLTDQEREQQGHAESILLDRWRGMTDAQRQALLTVVDGIAG